MSEKILASLRESAKTYGPVPFWSWNDRLEPEELRRQIRAMHSIGMNGFFMHARFGLETEYMSDEWFDCIHASVDEAKKLGMDAWSYDENGWPSGFAGGKLLQDEDNFARFMKASVEETFPAEEDVLLVCRIENNRCVKASREDQPPFCVIREGSDSSYVDVLRRDVTEKFIAATHEEYKSRLGGDLGGAMPGFFTDEPQYYRYAPPYSRVLPAEFQAKYGYALTDALPAVFWDFEGAEEYRYDYFLLIHELYNRCFTKPIYDWCEENGCQLTGHSIEEASLAGQMMCCGSVMPFYQYEHIPGIDYLGRGMQTDMSAKQLGSACAQLGKKKAMSETFACCGWDVSPRELKRIAEMQYAGGVNLMCQHLYPYSARGQRKRDYPAHYSEHNPWFEKLADFDRHFTNLGALLGSGSEYATTLVIHPIRDAYRTYKRTEHGTSVAQQDEDTRVLMAELAKHQVPYHFGEEGMMETLAAVEGNRIRVGACIYDYIIVPKMRTLSANTVRLLREFAAGGGKLCFVGDVPDRIDARAADLSDLVSTVSLSEIFAASGVTQEKNGEALSALRQRIRICDGRRIIFTANITGEDLGEIRMCIKNCTGAVGVSTDTLETYPLRGEKQKDGSLVLTLDFPASHSMVILEKDGAELLPVSAECAEKKLLTLPEEFTLRAPLVNTLTLDRASVSKDGGATWSEVRPIERIRDNLLRERYEGTVMIRYPFTVRDLPASAEIVWEHASVECVTVNGTPLTADGFLHPDRAFSRADAAHLFQIGENAVTLTLRYYQNPLVYDVLFGNVMESLRNCLNFDTEIECVYVRGDFRLGVDAAAFTDGPRQSVEYTGEFPIVSPRKQICLRDLVRDGLPFYGGAVDAETVFTWHAGEPTVFRPAGRFASCDVWVNGEHAGCVFFLNEADLAPYLREGENTVRLRLINALRNTAGPFHRPDPEPYSVSPTTFSYEKEWKDGVCPAYKERYAFVKFGI